MMSIKNYTEKILEELKGNASYLEENELQMIVEELLHAGHIFTAGAGRSRLAVQAFTNRLMHLGLTVYFVGEPTTPSIREGDLLVIASGSGETGSLKVMAQKAKKQGVSLASITIYPLASIGSLADAVIAVPGSTPKSELADTAVSVQPMGNAFEQMLWLICDTVVIILMKRLGRTEEEMFALHANLE